MRSERAQGCHLAALSAPNAGARGCENDLSDSFSRHFGELKLREGTELLATLDLETFGPLAWGGVWCCRLSATYTTTATVAPHQIPHDERPDGHENQGHQPGDRVE